MNPSSRGHGALRFGSRAALLAAFCLPVLAVPAPGRAEVREPRIANGVRTTGQPTTGALLLGSPAVQICSGTLVGCRTLLTAAHCVCDEDGSTCDPSESSYEVFLQHAGRFPVAQVTPHPDFVDFPSAANDVALVTLGAAVEGIGPTPLASTPPPFGTSGTLVGFGNLDDAPPTGSGIKREGLVTTTSCAPSGAPESQYLCWDPAPPFGPPGTDSNSCPGDSGGPLFVLEAGETVVAGAISFGLGPCAGDDFSGVSNVATYASWVAGVAGADLGGSSCAALARVGGPGAGVHGFEGVLAGTGSEQVHAFDVAAGATVLRVTLNAEEDGSADFDLAVRFGAPPAPGLNDCESRTASQFESCSLPAPAAGTWYAQAQSFEGSGIYQVTATDLVEEGAVCGDAQVEAGEECDDGNTLPGDGCDALCRIEGAVGICPATPAPGCIDSAKASLAVKESKAGKEKLKLQLGSLESATTQPSFGNPVSGATSYAACLYGAGNALVTALTVGPGGTCGRKAKPCWRAESAKGYRYKDPDAAQSGVRKLKVKAGAAGKGKLQLQAGNQSSKGQDSLPTGITAALQGLPGALVQLRTSDAECFEASLDSVKKAAPDQFKARVP